MKQSEKNLAIIVCILILACIITVIAFIAYFIFRTKPDDGHTHSYSETVISPTCTESGYTLHSCTCGESYNDTFVAAIGHSPKAAVTENEVTADCTKDGGYDEVVYCNECGETLSTEHKTIQKLGHTPKAAVTENEVTADCIKDGSYDEVVYCDVCGEKLSTEHKTIEKLAHNYEYGVCSVCKDVHYNVEDLKFTLSQDQSHYSVSGYNGNPTYANIPDTYLDKPVTSIADYAFEGCRDLTAVSIPNSLTTIGKNAFSGCGKVTSIYYTGDVAEWCNISGVGNLMGCTTDKKLYLNGEELTELIIPDSITSIGEETFYGCSSLKSVTISDGVKSIGYQTFYGCSGLKSVTIGKDVTTIDKNAFYSCSSLETVYWNAIACTGGWFEKVSDGSFIILHMFGNCNNLTSIVIGENVQSIPHFTFYNCIGLKSVTIPDSVTTIGKSAFEGCSSLETVYWNATNCTGGWFEEVSDGTKINPIFYKCDNLTTVVIGENVQVIADYLFYYCDSLKSITISDGVRSIGDKAFYNCNGLESVTIGKGVTTIGKSAFYSCSSLETVYWNAIDCECGWLVGTSIYLLFGNCDNLTTLVVGDGVEYIPEYAFYKCTSLESVILPVSIELIGKYAFYNCSNLKTVFYLGTEDDYYDYFYASNGNTDLISALYLYSEDEPEDFGQWWHYDEDGNMSIWEKY